MKYVNAKGLDLSAFALGTVQLGMQYGLGEDSAKPSEEKSLTIAIASSPSAAVRRSAFSVSPGRR